MSAGWASPPRPNRLKLGGPEVHGKGQHSVNMAALQTVLDERGKLGFNVKFMLETGEELSSPGLQTFCETHQARLKADVLIASDGPRLAAKKPTLYLGSRGCMNLNFTVELRDELQRLFDRANAVASGRARRRPAGN